MQGSPPWDDHPDNDQPTGEELADAALQPISITDGFAPMNQGTMLTGTTEMPTGQLIYLQPPSGAAKVIGVVLIIWGLLQGLGLLGLVGQPVDPFTGEAIEYPVAAKAVDGFSSVLGLMGFIAAGVLMRNYDKRGVWLAFGVIGAQFVLTLVSFQLGSPDGGLGSLGLSDGTQFGIWAGFSAFCSGFCALLVAIPLMVSNNGFE